MPSTDRTQTQIPLPCFWEAQDQALCLESTLADLSLYQFEVEPTHTGLEVAQIFEKYPALPGVVLWQAQQLIGMISRQQLLEYLIRPHGLELFLNQPLTLLYSYARTQHLILPHTISIIAAAQQALRRSPQQQREPLLVQLDDQTYRLLDVHELNVAYWQIRGLETQVRYERAQAQIIQSEKMASLGRLVDGVAHEILDPVGFIWGNLTHVSTYTEQLMQLIAAYDRQFPQASEPIEQLKTEIELDYLQADLPQTIESIRGGAQRLKALVSSLQNFCHIDDVYPKPADLHDCLDSILLLIQTRLTGEIEIVRDYGNLPPVNCYAGQLGQVFMNVLANAVDTLLNQAVRQKLRAEFGQGIPDPEAAPQIKVTTRVGNPRQPDAVVGETVGQRAASRWVSIRIADNGPGLSPEQQRLILDSFSVEHRIAKETSLAMSYQIVTAKHGGKFYFHSQPSESTAWSSSFNTEFEILLPLA